MTTEAMPTTTVVLCGTNPSTGRGCGKELAKHADRETAIQLAYEAGYGTHEGHFECDSCFEKRTNPKGDIAREEGFGYEQNYGVEIHFRTARTPHTCMGHPYCTIKSGQEYVEYVTPPWVMISDDPEGPGYRNGEFTRSRVHRYGIDHNQDGRPGEGAFRPLVDVEHEKTCRECSIPGHDTCSMTPGCPCCDDTMRDS